MNYLFNDTAESQEENNAAKAHMILGVVWPLSLMSKLLAVEVETRFAPIPITPK